MIFSYEGATFRYETADFSLRTTPDVIIVLKSEHFMNLYDQYFDQCPSKNVLELGVFEGGSLIYQALRHPEHKFVGIDKRKQSDIVLEHIKRLGLEDRIKIYYDTSQDDESAVKQIIEDNFGATGFDILSDDASHFYNLSRSSFEIIFPLLNDNGFYILEDWAWAHWDGYQTEKWTDQPALTNLVFELTMLFASQRGMIKDLTIFQSHMVARKGTYRGDRLDIGSLIKKRNAEFRLI